MFKVNLKNPASNGLAMTAGLSAWSASGFSTNISHLIPVITATLAGGASPIVDSTKANVPADSHIQTSYVNNIDSEE